MTRMTGMNEGMTSMTMRRFHSFLLLPLLLAAGAAQAGDAAFSDGWRFQQREGASLYAAICAGCHMPQGQGAQGAGTYPRLAGNPRLASGAYVATMVVHGRKAMPSFAQLDDAQIAAVVGYVRHEFGHTDADPVQPADVAALRRH
jgi:mono/diheme cytochrome c family protein